MMKNTKIILTVKIMIEKRTINNVKRTNGRFETAK